MKFKHKLELVTLHKRYKRFLADVTMLKSSSHADNPRNLTVYVPNTGSLLTCWALGCTAAIQLESHSSRKYPYTLVMTKMDQSWIGLHTGLANDLVQEGLELGLIQEFLPQDYTFEREVTFGRSRFDFLLTPKNPRHKKVILEVKNVTMIAPHDNTRAVFPDAVTSRGAKHLEDLTQKVAQGYECVMFYLVQREHITSFSINADIDPHYNELFNQAVTVGVKPIVYQCHLSLTEIKITQALPWKKV